MVPALPTASLLYDCNQTVLFPPINALFLMRTPTQSTVQEENLDQLVSWQSSWQGSWHGCVMLGTALVNSRHSATSACVPLSWRQDTAGRSKGQKQRSFTTGPSTGKCDVKRGRTMKPVNKWENKETQVLKWMKRWVSSPLVWSPVPHVSCAPELFCLSNHGARWHLDHLSVFHLQQNTLFSCL